MRQDKNSLKRKANTTVATHVIDGWTIRESLEPFEQHEYKTLLPIIEDTQVSPGVSNVSQWSVSHLVKLIF